MNGPLVVVWCLVGGFGAWEFRPRPPQRREEAPSMPRDRLEQFGRIATSLLPVLAPIPRHQITLVALGCVAVAPFLGLWSLALAAAALSLARLGARRSVARRVDRELAAVATIADLLGVALACGLGLGGALAAVQRRLRPGDDAGLTAVVVDLDRGQSVDAVLVAWASRGETVGELVALLRGVERSGGSIGDGLQRLGTDLRRRRRRRAEERARRLPVVMLLPLVICVLPAFGLVTVVPMVAIGLGHLGALP